jgi:uncharacterized coiled-coil protein SlyX
VDAGDGDGTDLMEATLITVSVTLLLALMGAVWRMSALATTLASTIREHKDDLQELRAGLLDLKRLPILEQRMAHVEEVMAKMNSIFPKHGAAIEVLQSQVGSLRDMRAARGPYRSGGDVG